MQLTNNAWLIFLFLIIIMYPIKAFLMIPKKVKTTTVNIKTYTSFYIIGDFPNKQLCLKLKYINKLLITIHKLLYLIFWWNILHSIYIEDFMKPTIVIVHETWRKCKWNFTTINVTLPKNNHNILYGGANYNLHAWVEFLWANIIT